MNNKEMKSEFSKDHALLLSLYQKNLTKHTQYVELNTFRRKIEDDKSGPHHKPYHAKMKQTLIYRSLFATIGCLFITLGYFIYLHSLSWQCTLLFANCDTLKFIMYSICSLFGGAAFLVSYSIRTEREAATHLANRAHKKLKKIFAKSQAKVSWQDFFDFNHRLAFKHANEKIHESLEVTFQLMNKITKEKTLENDEREHLFNQALLEYNDRLHLIINDFHKKITTV